MSVFLATVKRSVHVVYRLFERSLVKQIFICSQRFEMFEFERTVAIEALCLRVRFIKRVLNIIERFLTLLLAF